MKLLTSVITAILMISSFTLSCNAQPLPARQAQAYVLGKLEIHDLVLMGTTHQQPAILAMIAGLLPRLTSAGITHLALEVASDQQARIDHYLSTGKGLNDIVLHPAIDCPDYRRLLELLHRLPPETRPDVMAVDLPPARYGGSTGRDAFMAMALAETLQRPAKVKILAILGSLHVLRKLEWQPRITHGHASIRAHLSQWHPEISIFSMVHITHSGNMQSDFYRLSPPAGSIALDIDRRHNGWRLGITDSLALRPSQPFELVDGVIVH